MDNIQNCYDEESEDEEEAEGSEDLELWIIYSIWKEEIEKVNEFLFANLIRKLGNFKKFLMLILAGLSSDIILRVFDRTIYKHLINFNPISKLDSNFSCRFSSFCQIYTLTSNSIFANFECGRECLWLLLDHLHTFLSSQSSWFHFNVIRQKHLIARSASIC